MFDQLDQLLLKYDDIMHELAAPGTTDNQDRFRSLMKEQSSLTPIVETYTEYKKNSKEIEDEQEMLAGESDEEMRAMLKEELSSARSKDEELSEKLKILLLPKDPNDDRDVVMEIRAGVGGDEAALFASELYRMYSRYIETRGWKADIIEVEQTGLGGMKSVNFMVRGQGAYSVLKYESGVHRVQRVPETESGGRIHTSTATVAVMQKKKKKNVRDMKWKKFLYKQLCLQEGVYLCRSPSCAVWRDYPVCFGPDE